MLYASLYKRGIPGYGPPLRHVSQVIEGNLARARRRTGLNGNHIRPWLQAFPDTHFYHRTFARPAIQIQAADRAGVDGWMPFNPSSTYDVNAIQ